MALVLTGTVRGMRPVAGVIEEGSRKGEQYQFLSLEIIDPTYGNVYSCQMADRNPQYKEFVQDKKLLKDWTEHKVRVTITSQSAGERDIKDRATGETRTVLQIRSQITKVRDLGMPDDED